MTEITIISLISLITLGAIAFIFGRNRRPDGSEEPIVVGSGDCSTCSGNDPKCEQVCTMEAATKPIEYFDDEELDDETEQFAYVLHTLKPEDAAAWSRSLTLRNIVVPESLRDELILLIQSARE